MRQICSSPAPVAVVARAGFARSRSWKGPGRFCRPRSPSWTSRRLETNVRLSCQVKVRNNLRIEVPSELLAIRQYVCRCAKITDLTGDIKLFRLELPEGETMDYVAGQYVQLLAPAYGKNRKEVYRAYSIASDPAEKNVIELIIRLVPGGICTTYCFDHLKEGDEVRINGPYGDFHLSDTEAPMIFVAGGSGMAPIRCMLHQMRNTASKRKATYFFGANDPADLFLGDEMGQFESDLADYRYVPVVANPPEGSSWDGETGLVTEAVGRGLKEASGHEAYLCGSPGMIDATVKVLGDLGMDEEKIFYDKFA